jgi:hypothetical protein
MCRIRSAVAKGATAYLVSALHTGGFASVLFPAGTAFWRRFRLKDEPAHSPPNRLEQGVESARVS